MFLVAEAPVGLFGITFAEDVSKQAKKVKKCRGEWREYFVDSSN